MKTPCVIFPLIVGIGFTVGLVREHIFIRNYSLWHSAQNYCRQHYKDLSTITTHEENEMVINAAGDDFRNSWIGLNRNGINPNIWMWSDEQLLSFSNWKSGEPHWSNEQCVQIDKEGWFDDICWRARPFFCERILVLVKENKTWMEAYEFCRAHYTGLAFLSSQTQLNLAKKETNITQTVSVWTGLRFVGGEWLWVNGEPLGSLVSLPSCPAQSYRCGARNSKIDVWENRDCEEKLNFLCYE
ncbi:hypothetical protein NFI96_004235 [Prochilodus magdalenae]|nr:hypothetical protein NFI96_004235 [Prochilodus magdalenae]